MSKRVAIVGAGPAGLACAEQLAAKGGFEITVFEQKPSAARKFLMAGKTGLNISHHEDFSQFIQRYDHAEWLFPMIEPYNAIQIQAWMKGLGIHPYVGSSGRIFPDEMKAAPLLRAWLKRLHTQGVQFCYRHQITALNPFYSDTDLNYQISGVDLKSEQTFIKKFDVVVLACGALSWSQLGSDGKWQAWLHPSQIHPFEASNVGVLVNWSKFMPDYFGQPLKRIQAWSEGEDAQFGEMVISHYGLEGGLVYRCNRALRMQPHDAKILYLDLLPDLTATHILQKLQQSKKQSLNTLWQKLGLDKTKIALIRDVVVKQDWTDPQKMQQHIKRLAIKVEGFRPIEEAISCAGGIKADALDEHLMFKDRPNLYACGEMLDWDAPTGGYLLTACLATGRWVGKAISQQSLTLD